MNFYAVFFNHPGEDRFFKMRCALENSIKKNTPDSKLIVKKIDPPRDKNKLWDNVTKFKAWVEIDDDKPYALLDCDMLVREDVSEVFKEDFDIGLTRRTNRPDRINGGVVFVKPSENTRRFFNDWFEAVLFLMKNRDIYRPLKNKYLGICQPAFFYLLENNKLDYLKIKYFPCAVYNACEDDWKNEIKPEVKLLHLKTRLLQDELFKTKCLDYPHIKAEFERYLQ